MIYAFFINFLVQKSLSDMNHSQTQIFLTKNFIWFGFNKKILYPKFILGKFFYFCLKISISRLMNYLDNFNCPGSIAYLSCLVLCLQKCTIIFYVVLVSRKENIFKIIFDISHLLRDRSFLIAGIWAEWNFQSVNIFSYPYIKFPKLSNPYNFFLKYLVPIHNRNVIHNPK